MKLLRASLVLAALAGLAPGCGPDVKIVRSSGTPGALHGARAITIAATKGELGLTDPRASDAAEDDAKIFLTRFAASMKASLAAAGGGYTVTAPDPDSPFTTGPAVTGPADMGIAAALTAEPAPATSMPASGAPASGSATAAGKGKPAGKGGKGKAPPDKPGSSAPASGAPAPASAASAAPASAAPASAAAAAPPPPASPGAVLNVHFIAVDPGAAEPGGSGPTHVKVRLEWSRGGDPVDVMEVGAKSTVTPEKGLLGTATLVETKRARLAACADDIARIAVEYLTTRNK